MGTSRRRRKEFPGDEGNAFRERRAKGASPEKEEKKKRAKQSEGKQSDGIFRTSEEEAAEKGHAHANRLGNKNEKDFCSGFAGSDNRSLPSRLGTIVRTVSKGASIRGSS